MTLDRLFFTVPPMVRGNVCLTLLLLAVVVTVSISAVCYAQSAEGSGAITQLPQQGSPVKVGAAIVVNKVHQINEGAGTFTADVDIMYRWRDHRQAFNKGNIGSDRMIFSGREALQKLSTMWTPKIAVQNLTAAPQKEDHGLFIYADGTVQYINRLTGTFENQYNLTAFPFDQQFLSVRLSSTAYGISKVDIVTEQRDLDQSIIRQGWQYPGWTMEQIRYRHNRIAGWDNASFAELVGSVQVSRDNFGHIVLLFVPMTVILLFPTLSLIDRRETLAKQLQFLSGAVLALVTQYFAVTLRYPMLPVDGVVLKMFRLGFCYFFILLPLYITIFNQPFIEKRMHPDYVEEWQHILLWALPILLFSGLSYVLVSTMNGG